MTVKIKNTRFWKNYNLYKKMVYQCSMRSTVDAYVYSTIIQKYNFKNILEIGFFQRQTCGLLLEVTEDDAHITCVDPTPDYSIFNQVYKDLQRRVEILNIKSQDFTFGYYDLIIVDGDKAYDSVSQDIKNSIDALADHGMLLINEHQKPGVTQSIEELVLTQGFVPFLRTDQTLFFHKIHNDRGNFLDFEISKNAYNFIRFENIECWGFTTLSATTLPVFTDRLDFFDLALKEFDL